MISTLMYPYRNLAKLRPEGMMLAESALHMTLRLQQPVSLAAPSQSSTKRLPSTSDLGLLMMSANTTSSSLMMRRRSYGTYPTLTIEEATAGTTIRELQFFLRQRRPSMRVSLRPFLFLFRLLNPCRILTALCPVRPSLTMIKTVSKSMVNLCRPLMKIPRNPST